MIPAGSHTTIRIPTLRADRFVLRAPKRKDMDAPCALGHAEGKGVAYEAEAMRAYVYDVLGWRTIIGCIMPDDARSIALARHMGARRDGTLEHPDHGALNVWHHLREALQ
jgi:hypothetical protein